MESFFAGEDTVLDTKGQEVIGFFFNKEGKLKIRKRRSRITPKSILPPFGTTGQATTALRHMFGRDVFGRPKPLSMLQYLISLPLDQTSPGTVLDFFAGSGTTGHAVINLNREDGGERKFILVEMGEQFDTVLLPRLKKATYSSKWEDGRPIEPVTAEEAERSPRIIKVARLESYEDTLNSLNVTTVASRRERSENGKLLRFLEVRDVAGSSRERHLLRYTLDVDAQRNASLFPVDRLVDPTAYTLKVKRPGSDESRETPVDLIETFNWLLGLRVSRLWAPVEYRAEFARDAEGRLRIDGELSETAGGPWWFRAVEGQLPDNRRALIIRRKRPGGDTVDGIEQDNLVLNEWFKVQDWAGVGGAGATSLDVVYANGDHNLLVVRPIGARWEAHLLEEHFFRLMFEDDGPT